MEEQLMTSWEKLIEKLSGWVDAVVLNLPNLLIAIIVFLFAYWVSRNLQNWTYKILRKFINQPSIRSLISNIASISIVILGILLSLAVLNLDGTIKSLLAGAGIAGLAVGLALQGTLSNTFSGIFLALRKEVNVDDWIITNGYAGKVIEIDLRNTKVKEADNNIVVIPNKLILENPFKNYGLTQRIRCTVTCGVGYESDLDQVKDIAINAIRAKYPPNDDEDIEFYYTDFGSSSIDFMIRFWVDAKEKLTALQVKSEGIMAIKKAFNQHEINIPFPIRTIIQDNEVPVNVSMKKIQNGEEIKV